MYGKDYLVLRHAMVYNMYKRFSAHAFNGLKNHLCFVAKTDKEECMTKICDAQLGYHLMNWTRTQTLLKLVSA